MYSCRQYNEKLGVSMSGLLPYAMVLHLAFSVWMLSNGSIFQTSGFTLAELDQATTATGVIDAKQPSGQRIRQQHVFPLFLLLLILATVRCLVVLCCCRLLCACTRCWLMRAHIAVLS